MFQNNKALLVVFIGNLLSEFHVCVVFFSSFTGFLAPQKLAPNAESMLIRSCRIVAFNRPHTEEIGSIESNTLYLLLTSVHLSFVS